MCFADADAAHECFRLGWLQRSEGCRAALGSWVQNTFELQDVRSGTSHPCIPAVGGCRRWTSVRMRDVCGVVVAARWAQPARCRYGAEQQACVMHSTIKCVVC